MNELPTFTPRETVSELDRYIVGQREAKRSVAIALRNRWRRQQVPEELRDEIAPKNIIMIGATGVGKTEIARRLADDNILFLRRRSHGRLAARPAAAARTAAQHHARGGHRQDGHEHERRGTRQQQRR